MQIVLPSLGKAAPFLERTYKPRLVQLSCNDLRMLQLLCVLVYVPIRTHPSKYHFSQVYENLTKVCPRKYTNITCFKIVCCTFTSLSFQYLKRVSSYDIQYFYTNPFHIFHKFGINIEKIELRVL
jgi:hypothetical protein